MKLSLLLLLLCFSVASHSADLTDYTVGNAPDSVVVSIPAELVDKLRADVSTMSMSIAECKPVSHSFSHPSIKKNTDYTLNKTSAGCEIELRVLESRLYQCILPTVEVLRLAGAMLDRAKTDNVLGDFSEIEKAVLFDVRYCSSELIGQHR
jgi:hypothetical protein